MKSIVSGNEMKKIDEYTINKIGIPSMVLMERAALCVADLIMSQETKEKSILIVAGIGNNGADGLAIARILHLNSYNVTVFITGNMEHATKEFTQQYNIISQLEIKIIDNYIKTDIVVDALFGIGLSRNIEGIFQDIIHYINNDANTVYAVDIPSGIDANNGKILGCAIKADYTVTMGYHKIGTVLYPGADYCGKIIIGDIGYDDNNIIENIVAPIRYLTENDLDIIPSRPNYSNKGTFGKILIIAGSKDISGAAYMCALSAFKLGVGLVKIITHENNSFFIQKCLPEAMITTYTEENIDIDILNRDIEWCDVIAIGPGMGTGLLQKNIIERALDSHKSAVIDADGINNISEDDCLKNKLHNKVILTPHLGEMSRLINEPINYISDNLINSAKEFYDKYKTNIILKDARTAIVISKGIYINMTGNNGMATAGSGDILTGIISGLLGRRISVDDATVLAPYIHGLAGDIAAKSLTKTGMMATDIIDSLVEIINE